jgi:predicted flap endonuclease-1-like 5' DNA nuclease
VTWLVAEMWAVLLLAFAIGAGVGWWARSPSLSRPARRDDPVPVQVRRGPAGPPEAPRPSDGPADDLTRIEGIGPHYARLLTEHGVTTYRQIAEMTEGEAAWLDDRLGAGDRIEREDWRGQASALLDR